MNTSYNSVQLMVDELSAKWKKERAETQMTLGKMIDALAAIPPETVIEGFGHPDSYRGYYSDLAFDKIDRKMTAGEALEMAKNCMGEIFEGYKGGDYMMGRNTPIWLAEYGSCGMKIMGINDDGSLELKEDEY